MTVMFGMLSDPVDKKNMKLCKYWSNNLCFPQLNIILCMYISISMCLITQTLASTLDFWTLPTQICQKVSPHQKTTHKTLVRWATAYWVASQLLSKLSRFRVRRRSHWECPHYKVTSPPTTTAPSLPSDLRMPKAKPLRAIQQAQSTWDLGGWLGWCCFFFSWILASTPNPHRLLHQKQLNKPKPISSHHEQNLKTWKNPSHFSCGTFAIHSTIATRLGSSHFSRRDGPSI